MAGWGGYMQVAGLAYNAVNAWFAAGAQKENLRQQQVLAESNARIAERGAQSALYQGQRNIGAFTLAAGQAQSEQRARLAASGVDLGEGSATELSASSTIMKAWGMQDLEMQALYQAFGFRQQASNALIEANAAKSARRGVKPWRQVVSTLLSQGSEVNWASFGKPAGAGAGAASSGGGGLGVIGGYGIGGTFGGSSIGAAGGG